MTIKIIFQLCTAELVFMGEREISVQENQAIAADKLTLYFYDCLIKFTKTQVNESNCAVGLAILTFKMAKKLPQTTSPTNHSAAIGNRIVYGRPLVMTK